MEGTTFSPPASVVDACPDGQGIVKRNARSRPSPPGPRTRSERAHRCGCVIRSDLGDLVTRSHCCRGMLMNRHRHNARLSGLVGPHPLSSPPVPTLWPRRRLKRTKTASTRRYSNKSESGRTVTAETRSHCIIPRLKGSAGGTYRTTSERR